MASKTEESTPKVAENESAKHLFVDAYITIKQYAYGDKWNNLLLSNINGATQSLSIDKFLHLCGLIDAKKKFVQTLQKPYRGTYNVKQVDNPDIKIQGNTYFEEGFVFLEVLQSKNGSIAIASSEDVHQRMRFKLDETILLSYYNVFDNEHSANKALEELALERSVNLSECLTL